jgi:hypothetical protein
VPDELEKFVLGDTAVSAIVSKHLVDSKGIFGGSSG